MFSYVEDIGLATSLTFAQDYWGYYNGEHGNRGLIPDESQMYESGLFADDALVDVQRSLPGSRSVDYRDQANSNRGISVPHMKQGMLNKITYPTKGYTKFNFEPHQFLPSSDFGDYIIEASDIVYNSASGNYQENYMGSTTVNSRGAGLRIEEIISYDNDSRFVSRKKFSYEGESYLSLSTSGGLNAIYLLSLIVQAQLIILM